MRCYIFLDGELQEVEPTVVEEVFGVNLTDKEYENVVVPTNPVSDNDEPERCVWTNQQILKLIGLYKEHTKYFNSTTIRNEKVWGMIENKMKPFSAEQCKNKFKYLKSKYLKKKDNMSDKSSGAKYLQFNFFEEMDELFGKDPNITPVAIASTSGQARKRNNTSEAESTNEVSEENLKPEETNKIDTHKKTKRNIADQLKKISEESKEKEKNSERRHQENKALKERGLELFDRYMNYLMTKDNNCCCKKDCNK